MENMINNYINGNLKDAKKQAKKFGVLKIRQALLEIGWSDNKASVTAAWLKGAGCWEELCHAK